MVSSLLRWSHNEREAWGLSISLRYLMQRANWWPVEVNSEEWRNIPNMEIVKPALSTIYNLQSWTKIFGTLVHNLVFFFFSFRYSISILPYSPFNVVLLWTCQANCIAYHVKLQHWFRGVGSVRCPSFNGQDCRLLYTRWLFSCELERHRWLVAEHCQIVSLMMVSCCTCVNFPKQVFVEVYGPFALRSLSMSIYMD